MYKLFEITCFWCVSFPLETGQTKVLYFLKNRIMYYLIYLSIYF